LIVRDLEVLQYGGTSASGSNAAPKQTNPDIGAVLPSILKTNPAQYQKREAGTGDLLKAMPWFLIYHCKSSRGASKYAHATLSYNMKTEKIKY
jgi:hypothetical protein